jgi:hypothetical protein
MTTTPRHSELLQRYEVLGVTAPSTAHVVGKIFAVCFSSETIESILDVTPGAGNFWKAGVPLPARKLDASLADFRALPFADHSWDVVAFDPPHLAGLGKSSYFRSRYGTYQASELPEVIRQGAIESWRVARLGLLVKVTDHVNSAHFKRESQWVIEAIGQEPYEVVHVLHAAVGTARWPDQQMSARNNGSTLLVFKRGSKYRKRKAALQPSTVSGVA